MRDFIGISFERVSSINVQRIIHSRSAESWLSNCVVPLDEFAERIPLNAPRLWLEASLDQRQRFQSFCFRREFRSRTGYFEHP